MSTSYPSVTKERSSYSLQPIIVVGLGEIGWLVRNEWERRYKTYQEFRSPLVTDVTDTHFWMLPSDISELTEWELLSFEEHRQRFLKPETLADYARQIALHYHEVRAHTKLSLTDHARPIIFVVGATWSPVGRALLWPLAYLIRLMFGDPCDYELVGVFVAAQWEYASHAVLQRDALTYELLEEGNRLAQLPDWHQILANVFAHNLTSEQISFDKVFLIDNVKQNNTTSPATQNSAEIVQLVVDIIESCMHSCLLSIIDRSYTADHLTHHPLYLGIGISSLVVPLVRLYDNLINVVVTQLVRFRLLTGAEQSPLKSDNLEKEIQQELNVALLKAVKRQYKPDIEKNQTAIVEDQNYLKLVKRYEIGQTKQEGKIVVLVENVDRLQSLSPICIPQISLHIHGPDLLSPDESLQTIDERIDSEKNQIESFLKQFRETIRDYSDCLRSIEQICGQAIQAQLRTGDQGLVRAIKLTESVIEQVKNAVIETKNELFLQESKFNRLKKRSRSVQGVSPSERVKGVTPLFTRPQALLLRVLLIGIVCYQLYYDGLVQGIYIPPLDLLRVMLGEVSDATFRNATVGLITLCLGGLAIVTLSPWFVIRPYLFWARQYVRREQQAQLVKELIIMRLKVLTRLQSSLENYLQAELKRLYAELEQQHDGRLAEVLSEESYQEYSVVDLDELLQSFHNDVGALIQQHQRPLITSWLHEHPDLNEVWPTLLTKEEVFDSVRRQIGHVVKDHNIRPVSTYLATQNLEEWVMRISRSSVPWVKIIQPTSTLTSDAQNLPTEVVCLLALEGRGNPIAMQIAQSVSMCELLNWADPYRVMLVRIVGNLTSSQLVRWLEMRNHWVFVQHAAVQAVTPSILSQLASKGQGDLAQSAIPDQTGQNAQAIVGGSAHLAVSQTTDGVTGGEQTIDSFNKLRQDIQNLLGAARSNLVDQWIELELEGVEDAIRPLMQIQSLTPNPVHVVEALKELCYIYDKPLLTDSVRHLLSTIFRLIDGWFAQNQIRPLLPERGERYDPRIHGTAIKAESDPSLPSGTIKYRVRRGYIRDSNNKVLLEPLVIVVEESQ